MGGILAVTAGCANEPRLIVLRYRGEGSSGAPLGLVGKGVTFDTGGISIKPAAGMELMKKDMSGAAAVLEATGAIAELGLAVDVITVIPSVENMPSAHGDAARRHHHAAQRQDGRDQQHRRRGPADPRRRAHLVRTPGGGADRRRRDADRRRRRRARLHLRGADGQRRRLGGGPGGGRRSHRRAALAPAAAPRVQGADEGHRSPTSRTRPPSARRARSTPDPSWRSSSRGPPGGTSTSPARPGTWAANTSAPGPPASAFACSSNSPRESAKKRAQATN